jgi:hypothetical protein
MSKPEPPPRTTGGRSSSEPYPARAHHPGLGDDPMHVVMRETMALFNE